MNVKTGIHTGYQNEQQKHFNILFLLVIFGGGGGSRTYVGPYSHKGLRWFTECLPNMPKWTDFVTHPTELYM